MSIYTSMILVSLSRLQHHQYKYFCSEQNAFPARGYCRQNEVATINGIFSLPLISLNFFLLRALKLDLADCMHQWANIVAIIVALFLSFSLSLSPPPSLSLQAIGPSGLRALSRN